ncbi:hypothetical protein ACLOJK_004519, partial [Asimina triloba]
EVAGGGWCVLRSVSLLAATHIADGLSCGTAWAAASGGDDDGGGKWQQRDQDDRDGGCLMDGLDRLIQGLLMTMMKQTVLAEIDGE